MKIDYTTNLDTGGANNYVSIRVDGNVTEPGDLEFVLGLVGKLIEYDRHRAERVRVVPVCENCGMRHEPDDAKACIEGHGDDPPLTCTNETEYDDGT